MDTSISVDDIAQIAFEVSRVYWRMIDDQPEVRWKSLETMVVNDLKKGVKVIAENPSLTPRVAHSIWVDRMKRDGWKYGEEFDRDTKSHPALVEHSELPRWIQIRDRLVFVTIRALLGIGVDE